MLTNLQDSLKPTLRRDWNCPWVKRDGRGLKKMIRALGVEAPVTHAVATSKQHFYRSELGNSSKDPKISLRFCNASFSKYYVHSEPHSILDPQPSEEELREMQRRFLEEQVIIR